jgi:inactivated superfamily I helicase
MEETDMALNPKKQAFGLDVEGRFNRPKTPDTDTHTHSDAYEYTHTAKQETKSKRLYLLAKPSVHQKLTDYAKSKGDTFNNLVHTLMEQFIEENDL